MNISYRTKVEQRRLGDKLYIFEVIADMDEAIDQLCEALGPNPDPFAEDLCPYFGVMWPAAEGLAKYVYERKADLVGKKMIEVGCGLAFPSMVAAHLRLNVLATDFHPEVPRFLERNLRHSVLELPYQRFNWRDEKSLGKFDVVMGSDVLYESKHPGDVARGFERLLAPGGEVWLSDPGRGYLQRFVDEMEKAGFKHSLEPQTIGKQDIYLFCFRKN